MQDQCNVKSCKLCAYTHSYSTSKHHECFRSRTRFFTLPTSQKFKWDSCRIYKMFQKWRAKVVESVNLPSPWIKLQRVLICCFIEMKHWRGNRHNPARWNRVSCYQFSTKLKLIILVILSVYICRCRLYDYSWPWISTSVNAFRNITGAMFAIRSDSLITYSV